MSAARADRVVEWKGGTLDELITMLSGPAIPARIEILVGQQHVGEVHLVAGGVAEVIAGAARGDDALAVLEGEKDARFRIETRLPDPATGTLVVPGPDEGSLAQRPVVDLMRYCEDYVLTCALEVWRGDDHATIDYRRGELASTAVNGSDAEDALPDVMAWTSGHYRLVLPPVVLPAPVRRAEPPRPAPSPAARPHRETVPLVPTQPSRGTHPGMPVDVFGRHGPERTTDVGPAVAPPVRPAAPAAPTPLVAPASSAQRAPAVQPRVLTTLPARPAAVVGAPAQKAPSGPTASPARAAPRAPTPVAPPRRSLADLPLAVHVLLGLVVGGTIVGGYWVFQLLTAR